MGAARAEFAHGPGREGARRIAWSSAPSATSMTARVSPRRLGASEVPSERIGAGRDARGCQRPFERVGGGCDGQGELGIGRAPQLLDGALGHDAPLRDDADPVAQPFDQIELVGREDDRHSRGGLLLEDAAHHIDRDGVQAGERLVEHEQVGVVDQRRPQLDALLVA